MKKAIISSSVVLCLLAIFNVLVFSLKETFSNNFWASYVLITLSLLIMLISFIVTFTSKKANEVVGLPITTLSTIYAVFEIILGSLLMSFDLSFKIVFLPQIICFIIFLAIYVPALTIFLWKKEEKTE